MSKIVITGAGGYIGSIAVNLFINSGYTVVALDNFSTGFKKPLEILQKKYGSQKLRIYDTDLVKDDLTKVFTKEKNIDLVIHYAAFCSVDDSMKDPGSYFTNNVSGSINLISSMEKAGINKILLSSTCAVYGQSKYLPLDENHTLNPVNPYGHSKKIVEEIINWHAFLKNLKFIILRYFNVCGATEDGLLGDSKKPSPHLVQNAVRGALGLDSFFLSCPEVDTPDKSPIRDYVDVNDLNKAHLKAADYLLNNGNSEIINLGSGQGYSVLEIIRTVEEVTGSKLNIQTGNLRRGDPAKLVASIKKAKDILNWQPEKNLEDSIRCLVKWYQKTPKGWGH